MLLVQSAPSYQCILSDATIVCGLTLIVYEALRYFQQEECQRRQLYRH
jgi:hypothetical protein